MKRKILAIMLLVLSLSIPTYAKLTYVRTYYSKEVKLINQYDTGAYGYVSCLPTSIKMILDYQNIRSENISTMFYKMDGNENGVFTYNAIDYLNSYSYISAMAEYIEGKESFKYYIDQNVPYVLTINPRIINGQSDDVVPVFLKRIGKDYYTTQNSVHAIAVVGYVEVGEKLYLEVLDPLSRQILFYDADNVMESLEWSYLVTIQKYEPLNKESTE